MGLCAAAWYFARSFSPVGGKRTAMSAASPSSWRDVPGLAGPPLATCPARKFEPPLGHCAKPALCNAAQTCSAVRRSLAAAHQPGSLSSTKSCSIRMFRRSPTSGPAALNYAVDHGKVARLAGIGPHGRNASPDAIIPGMCAPVHTQFARPPAGLARA